MYHRLLITGTGSDVGKTFVTTGIIRNFRNKGKKIQAYKVGPDYIDPQYHKIASERPSKNLDSYLMNPSEILELFCRTSKDVDISIIEGVRGLYEGPYYHSHVGSTAHIARILKIPVIIVVNTRGLNKSVVAILKGFKEFGKEIDIKGVILNNVAGERHEEKIVKSIKKYLDIEVLGSIPRKEEYVIQKRHLGLVTPDVSGSDFIKIAENAVREHVDLDRLEEIASQVPVIKCGRLKQISEIPLNDIILGIVYNPAFNFYYAEFLEALKILGVNLRYIDVLSNETAEVDALYIGGGYPELYAAELEKNRKSRRWIKEIIDEDTPVYAECGGLIYLSQNIHTGGSKYKMVGGIACEIAMTNKRRLSLTRQRITKNVITGQKGSILKGHEFHYTEIVSLPRDVRYAYEMRRGYGIDGKHDGLLEKNVLASYSHAYLASYKHCSYFVDYIKQFSKK